jgi:serine/threonine protein kinase
MTEGDPTAPQALRLAPGQAIAGKYVVEHTIATGGMGVVVAARHAQIQHRVALKVLLPHVRDENASARFLREAQNAMSIRSEHVARVMDVGTLPGGESFLVMEYLEGLDLARLLEQRVSIPVPEAVGYVLQALVALSEAHSLGIVHRDLKPSNLFLTERPDGTPLVKVLDFGISKQLGQGGAPNLTSTQGLMGSPLYMSPEQIRSARDVDERSDIWALGVMLHELCAGKPPFNGVDVGGVLASIIADAPPAIETLKPDVPAGFGAIIRRCLAKSPDDRYADVGELARALAPFAPPEAQTLVARIAGISERHQSGKAPRRSKPAPDVPVEATAPLTKTTDAFSNSQFRKSKGAARWVGLSVVMLALGLGLFVWARGSSRSYVEPDASVTNGENALVPAPREPSSAAQPGPANANPSVTIEGELPAPPASSVAPAVRAPSVRKRHPPSAVVAPKPKVTAPSKTRPTRDVSELIDDRL